MTNFQYSGNQWTVKGWAYKNDHKEWMEAMWAAMETAKDKAEFLEAVTSHLQAHKNAMKKPENVEK